MNTTNRALGIFVSACILAVACGDSDEDASRRSGVQPTTAEGGAIDSGLGDALMSGDSPGVQPDAPAEPLCKPLDKFSPEAGTLLADALENTKNLYLPPGDYHLDRTVTVKGSGKTILGAGRFSTWIHLVGNASIVFDGADNVTFGNMGVSGDDPQATGEAIRVTGSAPSNITFLALAASGGNYAPDTNRAIGRAAFNVDGPGEVFLQGVHINLSDAALIVNHPNANVHLVGGNHQSNNIHVHQKQGRLDMRAVGVQQAFDQKDIIIESAATGGAHLIEGCRSEGPGSFVVVPTTTQAVNLVVQANALPVAPAGGAAVSYGGQGTLWLVSNNMKGNLVATGGVINSFGNAFNEGYDPPDSVQTPPFAVTAPAGATSIGDILTAKGPSISESAVMSPTALTASGQSGTPAQVTFATSVDAAKLPPPMPPVTPKPWPCVTNVADLMPDLKRDFGAVGDGVADDTAALAKAFTASRTLALHIPEGRYRTTAPVQIEHWRGATFWGEGGQKSVIVADDGSAFRTNGCGYTTFVGLGFQTKKDATSPAMDITWDGSNTDDSLGSALQANMFYDNVFDGGSEAVSIGAGGYMGSEHLFVNSTFTNAKVGLATRNYNALSDVALGGTFSNLDTVAEQNYAGSFHLYGAGFKNIAAVGLHLINTAWDTFIVSDSTWSEPVPFLQTGFTGAQIQVLLSRMKFTAVNDAEKQGAFNYGAGGSLVLANTDLGDRTVSCYSAAVGAGTEVVLAGSGGPTAYGVYNHCALFK